MIDPVIYYGTSGIVIPIKKEFFPPAYQGKSRLAYYASLYNSIEINSTFYRMPQEETVKKWAAEVPSDFRFTFKLLKDISHSKGDYEVEVIQKFVRVISNVGDKKGCILIQFPPSFQSDKISTVEKLLQDLNKADNESSWRTAIEFRHPTWYTEDTYKLVREFDATIVNHDYPKSVPPVDMEGLGHKYLRLHGPGVAYRGSYTEEVLEKYSVLIKGWEKNGCDVYCYFNNTMGAASENLLTLRSLVS